MSWSSSSFGDVTLLDVRKRAREDREPVGTGCRLRLGAPMLGRAIATRTARADRTHARTRAKISEELRSIR